MPSRRDKPRYKKLLDSLTFLEVDEEDVARDEVRRDTEMLIVFAIFWKWMRSMWLETR
jgi:hypothetical protein